MYCVKRNILVFLFLAAASSIVFYQSFFNFFAQDDFILISQFSQNGLWQNLVNIFGKPTVTHWRPFHNLYFLISGSLFGRNYIGYHLLTLAIHILGSFLIYKICEKILKNQEAAGFAAIFYLLSPINFVSLFWISGSATTIGFMFLAGAFYSYLNKRFFLAIALFVASCMASEAMVFGAAIFLAWEELFGKLKMKITLLVIGLTALLFAFLQLTLFVPASAIDSYRIEFSPNIIFAFKYYLLRLPGFIEGAGVNLVSSALMLWLAILASIFVKELLNNGQRKFYIFAVLIIAVGLFPFALVPNHLSPHYMNISLWGLSMLIGLILVQAPKRAVYFLISTIVVINAFGIATLQENSWVTKRSNLAKSYLLKIGGENRPQGSTIIFDDNTISTSLDAYYALGTGKAIEFWFPNKSYKTCFTVFETCRK